MFSGNGPRLTLSLPRNGKDFPATLTDWISSVFVASTARNDNASTVSKSDKATHVEIDFDERSPKRTCLLFERRLNFTIKILTAVTQIEIPEPVRYTD